MRAIIGITAGDPAGIGLEVVLKAISPVVTSAHWILFTDRAIFERNASIFKAGVECRWIQQSSEITAEPVLFLKDLHGDGHGIEFGKMSAVAGSRALSYLEAASAEAIAG